MRNGRQGRQLLPALKGGFVGLGHEYLTVVVDDGGGAVDVGDGAEFLEEGFVGWGVFFEGSGGG